MNEINGSGTQRAAEHEAARLRDGRKVIFAIAQDLTGEQIEIIINGEPGPLIVLLTGAANRIAQVLFARKEGEP